MHAIHWFEIPVANFQRAVAFYEQILAVKLNIDNSFPGMRLAIFPSDADGIGGCLIAFEQARPHADGVRVYLNGGDDLAAILARVPGAHGQVIMEKTRLRDDIGCIGMFSDSEGNIVGLHSLN